MRPNPDRIEADLRARRSRVLPDDAGFCIPDYAQRSLCNVASTLLCLLTRDQGFPDCIPGAIRGPLPSAYWEHLPPVRHVVVVLADGLGYVPLRSWLADGQSTVWSRMATAGCLLPMTSVVPTTTATALASLFTGQDPIAHGLLGYELWLGAMGVVAQMLGLLPAHGPRKETLIEWGLVPEMFLPGMGIGNLCDAAEVEATAVLPRALIGGALTRMCYRGFHRFVGYDRASEMWRMLRESLSSSRQERSLHVLYWHEIDRTVHDKGATGGHWQRELDRMTGAARTEFFARLTAAERRDTAIVLLADHGFVDTPPAAGHALADCEAIGSRLLMPPTGDARLAYLHLRASPDYGLPDINASALGDAFCVVDAAKAIEAGLFGDMRPHNDAARRLGDAIAMSRGSAFLSQPDDDQLLGRHGGLTPDEMLVPWLACHLGAL